MKKSLGVVAMLLLCLLYSACVQGDENENFVVEGLKPVYATGTDWQQISVTDSRPIQQLGKIYYKDGFIFVNEVNQGIHILDNSNPANPTAVKFIVVPGSKDISIKGNFLYTDNVTDLVVLDISDFQNIETINRVPNIYPSVNQEFPEFGSGYFECIDTSKGTIIGWESDLLQSPQCRI
ncbi:MAG: hypothetical protein ACI94Y_000243 [Maribacter sp.]|jgi:hypothetical protein